MLQKHFDILATSLNILHNYFHNLIKLSNFYLVKILNTRNINFFFVLNLNIYLIIILIHLNTYDWVICVLRIFFSLKYSLAFNWIMAFLFLLF